MKYKKLVEDILLNVGGVENINSVTHCVTRLRFKLKNEEIAKTDVLKAMNGVMEVIRAGGEYQVVIGTHVTEVYKEFVEISGVGGQEPVTAKEKTDEKTGLLSRFLGMMSGIFQPILSILMASGMIKAILTLCTLTGILTKESQTYVILNAIGNTIFYFFPIVLGWSASKKFGIKEIYGIVLGGCLVYPSIVALSSADPLYTIFTGTIFESNVMTEIFGIPVILPMQTYASSVIPIILIVYVASKIYKFLNEKLPSVIRSLFVPLITLLVTVPLAMIIIGPIAMFAQDLLGAGIQALIGLNPGIAGLILGTFWSVLVMFGLHMAIIPLFAMNVTQFGYDIINPLIFSGALASMGAVLGIIIRTKSIEEKNICVPAIIATLFGVNEPTLYGVLIPRKKVMISCFVSAGIGSMIAGFSGAKLYQFGASGIMGLPCFINPNGIDMGFIGLCIGAVISFVLAMISAMVIGDKRDAAA
ncbi:PTS transporter subunit EIIC [Konateibacter massiliensis]|uniref:PTS transporter subunit EIIC n=1 Tax=Konateibacter massiliensis TaxID=2002841 RepID=UPI000C14F0F2|nr:PTS transporter subunit EIIC [Konateibacter massiliensis]